MNNKLASVASILLLSACAVMDEGLVATASLRPASGREAHGQLKFTQVGPTACASPGGSAATIQAREGSIFTRKAIAAHTMR